MTTLTLKKIKGCTRCPGQMFWDLIDKDWFCVQCGEREYLKPPDYHRSPGGSHVLRRYWR